MECFTADFLWLVFTSLKMSWNPKNDQVLDKKKENLFNNTALLQLEQSYLTQKCKIVFFERYNIQVFGAIELP